MRRFYPLLAAFTLTACATKPAPDPVIRTSKVDMPVARSCIPKNFRDPPETPDTDAAIMAAAGPGDMLQLLAAGRLLRNQWIKEATPVINACR